MMNSEEHPLFTIAIDGDWHRLPTASDDYEHQIHTLVGEFGVSGSTATRLGYGLRSVAAVAGSLPRGERHSFALIRDPASGVVDALLSTRTSRVTAGAIDEYRARLVKSDVGEPDISIVNRRTEERRLPQGVAIVTHDFTLREDGDGLVEPALERVILALFLGSAEVLIEFYLATQNLALFDNAVEYLVELVSGKPTIETQGIQ